MARHVPSQAGNEISEGFDTLLYGCPSGCHLSIPLLGLADLLTEYILYCSRKKGLFCILQLRASPSKTSTPEAEHYTKDCQLCPDRRQQCPSPAASVRERAINL